MQNQSQVVDTQAIEFNLWLEIWISPRKTIRRIVDSNPTRWVLLLAALAGVANVLNQASARSLGDSLGLPGILAVAVVLGPLLGLAGLGIGGWWYRWTGSWFGGQANTDQVRAAIAWSGVTSIVGLALWIPQLALFGNELFTKQTPALDANPYLALALLPFGFARIVIGIWQFVILVKCLAEVHRFSSWRALGAILLPALVIAVPLVICVVLATVASR